MCVDPHDIREAIAGEGDMRYLIRPCVSRASLEPVAVFRSVGGRVGGSGAEI